MRPDHLPVTYYDLVMRGLWPALPAAIRADVAYLTKQRMTAPLADLNGFPSRWRTALREAIQTAAADLDRAGASDHPEARSLLASQAQSAFLSYLTAINFELAGQKTFWVRDPLAEKLLVTSVDAPTEMLQMPFACCQLVFTAPAVFPALTPQCAANPTEGSMHANALVCVYVTELKGLRDDPEARALDYIAVQVRNGRSQTFVQGCALVEPGKTLSQAIATNFDPRSRPPALLAKRETRIFTPEHDEVYDWGEEWRDPLRTLIFNTLLYISSRAADLAEGVRAPTPSRKAPRSERRAAQALSSLSHVDVGRGVTPIVIDPHAAMADSFGAWNVPLRALQRRVAVRGHWRQQACGTERQERKLIWIEPHFRGPEFAEAINNPYIVRQ